MRFQSAYFGGNEASLSYVQRFLYLVSSSVNISSFRLHDWIPTGQISYVLAVGIEEGENV